MRTAIWAGAIVLKSGSFGKARAMPNFPEYQGEKARRPPGRKRQALMSRLPPTPAGTLACDGALCPVPSSVSTVDFCASRFDFKMLVATCVCSLPA
jgi:hypothetical protein